MRSWPLNQVALHLDPQTLRILVAIEDYGSFSGAAEAVNLVPSAVSRRVQELESAVGLDLVKRNPRSVEFTGAGKRLLVRVRRILNEMEEAISDLDQIGQGLAGSLRIATSMFALHGALPDDLANFKRRYSRVELEFETLPSQDIISALQRAEIDVGVLAASVMPEALNTRMYCAETVVLMVPRDHPLSGSTSVRFDDFCTEGLLQLPAGADIQQILDSQARRNGVKLRMSHRVGSLDAAVAMTRAGHGLTIIPRSSWESLGPFQGLSIVSIDETWSRTQLWIAIRPTLPETSPGYRLFSELAAQPQQA